MSARNALKAILVIAVAGMLFSGYLSYYELFVPAGCSDAIISCGVKNVSIAGLPACVYGLIMYSIVFLLSLIGLLRRKE